MKISFTFLLATFFINAVYAHPFGGDTTWVWNMPPTDPVYYYTVDYASPADSGCWFGTNVYGHKGWAESYAYDGTDSTVSVIGYAAMIGGHYSATTAASITFKVWSQGPASRDTAHPNIVFNGLPQTELASASVPINKLGIYNFGAEAGLDTGVLGFFPIPTGYLSDTFFIGYEYSYNFSALHEDTVNVKSTEYNHKYGAYEYTAGTDTVVKVVNARLHADNTWHDIQHDNELPLKVNLLLWPIVKSHHISTGTGIVHNNLKLYGCAPNPASNYIDVSFYLEKPSAVDLLVIDAKGTVVKKIHEQDNAKQSYIEKIETTALPAGDYFYIIRTSDGDGIGGQFTVTR